MKNLSVRSIDIMKKTKDTVISQLSDATKEALLNAIDKFGATHVSISLPMDTQAVMVANGTTPSSRSISAETQDWCTRIHAHGMNVIHRGTLCGAEAIWGASFYDGGVSIGTSASAPTDASNTLAGKYYQFLWNNVSGTNITDGDIFSPLPEGTTHAFDGHYFWPAGSQANFIEVYRVFHQLTDNFAASSGKSLSFMSHNNYSEVNSGWIPGGMFSNETWVGYDYYGQSMGGKYNHPQHYIDDLVRIYQTSGNGQGIKQFQGEWGAINGNALPSQGNIHDRWHYLIRFYKQYRDTVVANNILSGFNYWGGWEGQNTSLLWLDGSTFRLNGDGRILANFYIGNGGMERVPVDAGGTTTHNYYF